MNDANRFENTKLSRFPEGARMSLGSITMDADGLRAAARALAGQLCAEATQQRGYLHAFADGKVSVELEWIDPADLARAAVEAYLNWKQSAKD